MKMLIFFFLFILLLNTSYGLASIKPILVDTKTTPHNVTIVYDKIEKSPVQEINNSVQNNFKTLLNIKVFGFIPKLLFVILGIYGIYMVFRILKNH